MNFEIKKLSPKLAEDYVNFFDAASHNNGEKCYCVTWRNDDSYTGEAGHWFPTAEERRNWAMQFVKSGSIQGYLAYCDGEVVGWCNANGNCQFGLNYLRMSYPIEEPEDSVRVKSIFCFVIAPHMRRKGVATRLLEHICQDALAEGFDFIEAYVNREFTQADREFRGPIGMYEKCGFTVVGENNGKAVMRKALR